MSNRPHQDPECESSGRYFRRKTRFWRLVALASIVLLIIVSVGLDREDDTPFIARLTVDDIILSDSLRTSALKRLIEDDRAEALLVYVNSPGGTMVGAEDIYAALRRFAQDKPVVVVMGEFATSAGYLAALGGDWILAHEGTITGSVGVIFQSSELSDLFTKLGIRVESVRSGDLKARPDFFTALDAASRDIIRTIVEQGRDYFVDLVVRRRGIDEETRRLVADGRILSGRQALDRGLVDAIGGEYEAIAWLETQRGLAEDLPVRDVKIGPQPELWQRILDVSLHSLGAETIPRLGLDGLVSLWQAR